MSGARSQRWRERREAWVPDASEIVPAEFAVDLIRDREARAFVEAHHYSASFPAARLCAGLFRGRALVGVAVFSVPMNQAAIPAHTKLEAHQGADLGRLVLLDEVGGNGETWFLSRAFRLLRREKPDVLAVTSYADPMPRRTAHGDVVKPGHVGAVYQEMGAAYRGRGRARREHLTPDGQPFSERARSKILARDRGHAYAIDELVRRGAPRPAGDDLRDWYGGLLASGFITERQHPGNHVYAFTLTRAARLAGRDLPRLPYPDRRIG